MRWNQKELNYELKKHPGAEKSKNSDDFDNLKEFNELIGFLSYGGLLEIKQHEFKEINRL